MRLHLADGENKTLSDTFPVRITGWLVDTNGIDDAVLHIIDANGDVTPVGGFKTSGEIEHAGVMGLNEGCWPIVSASLSGTGATATIYYEQGKVVYE